MGKGLYPPFTERPRRRFLEINPRAFEDRAIETWNYPPLTYPPKPVEKHGGRRADSQNRTEAAMRLNAKLNWTSSARSASRTAPSQILRQRAGVAHRLRDYLLDPRSVRLVEHVGADLRAMYDEYEDDRAKIEGQLDQVECELQDMRERFGALLQQHIELCAQYGVEKGEHRSNGALP